LEEEESTKTFFQLNAGVCMVSDTSDCTSQCISLQPFAEHKECGKISRIWPPKCISLVTQPKHIRFV
jgi:hypothetical protein